MTTLIFVRHGNSEANAKRIFAGHYDAELTELGYKQAQCTADYISERFKPDIIYSSDLKRAYATAECISEKCGVKIVKEKNLREISAGKWDGMSFADLPVKYKEDYDVWMYDIGNAVCTGGESVKQLSERVYNAVLKIVSENKGKTVVITTHATPIRCLECMLKNNMELNNMKNINWVSNASVTIVNEDDGKLILKKTGEDAHLDDLKTTLPANV